MSADRPKGVRFWSKSLLAVWTIVLCALSLPSFATGQEAAEAARDSSAATDSAATADSATENSVDKFLEGFRLYGSVRAQLVTYEGATEI